MNPEEIGEQIRQARDAKGWSQARLGKESGVGQPYISRLESGEFPNVETATLERVATALGLRLHITLITIPEVAAATAA